MWDSDIQKKYETVWHWQSGSRHWKNCLERRKRCWCLLLLVNCGLHDPWSSLDHVPNELVALKEWLVIRVGCYWLLLARNYNKKINSGKLPGLQIDIPEIQVVLQSWKSLQFSWPQVIEDGEGFWVIRAQSDTEQREA